MSQTASMTVQNTALPIFKKMLGNLQFFLGKARADAKARGYDVDVLMQSRLAPDMLSLAGQIRYVCISAKAGAARMAGVDVPAYDPTDDATVEVGLARLASTIAWLDGLPADGLATADSRTFMVKVASDGRMHEFTGPEFVKHWVMAHFHFHVIMAYAILRHNGVPLGKVDFIWGEAQVA